MENNVMQQPLSRLPSVFFFGVIFSVLYTMSIFVGAMVFEINDISFYSHAVAGMALVAGVITMIRKGKSLTNAPVKVEVKDQPLKVTAVRDHTKLYSFLALFTIGMSILSAYFYFYQHNHDVDTYTNAGILVALTVSALLFGIDMMSTKPSSTDELVMKSEASEIHVHQKQSSLPAVLMISMGIFLGMSGLGYFYFGFESVDTYSIMMIFSVIIASVAVSFHAYLKQGANTQVLKLEEKEVHLHTQPSSLPKVLSLFAFFAIPSVALSALVWSIEGVDYYSNLITVCALSAAVIVAVMKKIKA